MSAPVEPEYMKPATLAAKLDVCPATVRDWESRGYIPKPRKIGQTRLYHWPSVKRAIEASTVPEVESADPFMAALSDDRPTEARSHS